MFQERIPPIPVAQIRTFEPSPAWFVRDPVGIHGLGHETRVLIWAQVLAAMTREEGLSVDAVSLGWAAAIHDTQRLNDGIDAGHGLRAAQWLASNLSVLPPDVSPDAIAYLCKWHVPPDASAPEMIPDLQIFKDADALDRWRIADLDPTYLRTQSAHRLLKASHELWASTQDLNDPASVFHNIVDRATRMGILQID